MPVTVGVQVEVCVVRIDAGVQLTETDVMLTGTVTVTLADPDLLASWIEVPVIVAVPDVAGVKTPALLMEPALDGDTDHETAEL